MAEERLQRRLAAILSADVVGYSRLMGIDEAGTLTRLKVLRRGGTLAWRSIARSVSRWRSGPRRLRRGIRPQRHRSRRGLDADGG